MGWGGVGCGGVGCGGVGWGGVGWDGVGRVGECVGGGKRLSWKTKQLFYFLGLIVRYPVAKC